MRYKYAGRMTFGAVNGVEQVTITRSRGIMPSTIQFVVPKVPVMPIGSTTLFLSDGVNQLEFKDCILQSVDGDFESGERYVVTLLDERWKWNLGQISGSYNTIRADNIVPATRKKPQELAILCLVEMGVKKHDVKALPNTTYPEITWDLDVPAVALESLCGSLGCVVCLQLDGSVLISKQGVGKKLPTVVGGMINASIKADPAPDEIWISAAPTVWEISLELDKPVGIQDDGKIVPIDELKYKPTGGWETEDPRTFGNVPIDKRKLANECVWRWFTFKVPIKLPELDFEITDPAQIYFEDVLVEKQTVLGIESRKPRLAYGRFYDYKDAMGANVEKFSHDYDVKTVTDKAVKKRLVYDGSFEIDQDKMIIKFSDPLVLSDWEKAGYKMADVRLRVAIGVKDPKTNVKFREVYKLKTGRRNNTKPKWIRKEDVRREIVVDPKTGGVKETAASGSGGTAVKLDNVDDVKKKLKECAGFEMGKLEMVTPQQGTYPGFMKIDLDGAIEQVTYTIDSAGFTGTVASYGTEHSFVVPSFEERKRIAKLTATLTEQAQVQNSKQDGTTNR